MDTHITEVTKTHKLPLSFDEMKEFIIDPLTPLVIDYKNSQLKDRALMVYCTNVSMQTVDVDFANCTTEEKFGMIDAYISHKSTFKIQRMIQCVVRLLMYAKGIQLADELKNLLPFGVESLTDDEIKQYCENDQRRTNLIHLLHVLDSIPLYMLTTNTSFEQTYGKPVDVFETIDDINYTGYTFVNLLEHPVFLLQYYTVPFSGQRRYFKQQFEESLYGGKILYSFFVNNENNYLLALFDAIFSGKLTPEFFNELNQAALKETQPNDTPIQ